MAKIYINMRKIVNTKYRLFAYGCSFSSWTHPTPLDWLSSCFDSYRNFGEPGGCTTLISDKVNKDFQYKEESDLMFIQWTGLLRYTPKSQTDITEYATEYIYPWESGDIEHPYNMVLQYYNNTRNLFSSLKLNRNNYITTHMLSPWLSDTLGEPNGYFYDIKEDSNRLTLKRKYDKHFNVIVDTGLLKDIETLFKLNNNTVESMLDFYLRNNIAMNKPLLQYLPDSDSYRFDHHPAPIDTLLYAREVLAPKVKSKLGIDLSYLFSNELDLYAETWMYFLKKEKKLIKDRALWTNTGKSITHTNFKPYIPWFIKNGKITEYKLSSI